MQKSDIIKLINKWDDFTKESATIDFEHFALWLLRKEEGATGRTEQERLTSYLLSRIDRYSKAQIKQLFHDLPIIGYDDFILLNTVYNQPNIPKKELYEQNIYDMNSGTQVVNRLKREGLLVDFQSETDKRVFLLNITELGKTVRNTAFELLGKKVAKKYRAISDTELEELLILVRKLESDQE